MTIRDYLGMRSYKILILKKVLHFLANSLKFYRYKLKLFIELKQIVGGAIIII